MLMSLLRGRNGEKVFEAYAETMHPRHTEYFSLWIR